MLNRLNQTFNLKTKHKILIIRQIILHKKYIKAFILLKKTSFLTNSRLRLSYKSVIIDK